MARTNEPGLNSGLPYHDGLDEDTKQALLRAANRDGKPVVVGGIQDVQRYFGEKAVGNEIDIPLPPGETADSVITTAEHDELMEMKSGVPHGEDAENFEDSTVEELKDKLRDRGESVSGTKDELIARLEGRE
jgi:SAP domain